MVQHLRSINSKNPNFNIFGCRNRNLSKIGILGPDGSLNIDEIKIKGSHKIKISCMMIAIVDECIAMLSESTKIHISKVFCSPGHRIYFRSLGKNEKEQDVHGIVVKKSSKIKTQFTPPSCKTSNHLFQYITMENVLNPINIDQLYCPYILCDQ